MTEPFRLTDEQVRDFMRDSVKGNGPLHVRIVLLCAEVQRLRAEAAQNAAPSPSHEPGDERE